MISGSQKITDSIYKFQCDLEWRSDNIVEFENAYFNFVTFCFSSFYSHLIILVIKKSTFLKIPVTVLHLFICIL